MSFFWRSQKGSIAGNLIALSVMGVSMAGLFHYMVNFEKNIKGNIESRENETLISRMAAANMKSLLVRSNVNGQGQPAGELNRYGICSLLSAPPASSGTQALLLNFNHIKTRPQSWSKKRWQYFFSQSEWKFSSPNNCKKIDDQFTAGALSKCLEYTGGGRASAYRTFVIAKISPQDFFSAGTRELPLTAAKDPKEVMFHLTAKVGSYYYAPPTTGGGGAGSPGGSGSGGRTPPPAVKQDITYFHRTTDIIWAGDAGECQVQTAAGQWTTVRFSGTVAGTSLARIVINDALYGKQKQCQQIKVGDLNKDIIQVGRLNTGPLSLSSVLALNTKVSCTVNTFRCKPASGKGPSFTDKEIDPFQFSFGVYKGAGGSGDIPIKKINITFKTKNGAEIDKTNNGQLEKTTITLKDGSGTFYANQDNQNMVLRGEKKINVLVNMDQHCRDLCANQKAVYPVIDIDTPDDTTGACFKRDYSTDSSNKVRCTVCYMKACHRVGLGTFGPLYGLSKPEITAAHLTADQLVYHGLPDEALDSQVPECHSQTSSGQYKQDLPVQVRTKHQLNPPCKGLAVEVSQMNDFKNLYNKRYRTIQCNRRRPVLCFINGHYLPAVRINPKNVNQPVAIVHTDFASAENACKEMGRETGSLRNLGLMFEKNYQASHPSTAIPQAARTMNQLKSHSALASALISANLKFNFVNNAARGMFLAPVNHVYSSLPGSRWFKDIFAALFKRGGSVKMWTAIELDGGGLPMASVPWAGAAKNDPFALFYHKAVDKAVKRPVLLKDTQNFNASSSYFGVTYNIRWKGIFPVSDVNQNGRFVCYKEGSVPSKSYYFVTKAVGPLNKAGEKCSAAGGVFVPPVSSADWVRVMLLLQGNDAHYPFPNPFPKTGELGAKLDFTGRSHYMISKAVPYSWAYVALKSLTAQSSAVQGPRVRDLRFYAPSAPAQSIFKQINLTNYNKNARPATGLNIKGELTHPLKGTSGYQFLSLCVSIKTRLPHSVGSYCPGGTRKVYSVSSPTSNTWFRPNSVRFSAKLYRLLKKRSHQANKDKIIVQLNAKHWVDSVDTNTCPPGYYKHGNSCCRWRSHCHVRCKMGYYQGPNYRCVPWRGACPTGQYYKEQGRAPICRVRGGQGKRCNDDNSFCCPEGQSINSQGLCAASYHYDWDESYY